MGVEELESHSPDDSATITDAQADQPADTGADSSKAPEGDKLDLLSVVRDATAKTRADATSPVGPENGSDKPSADASASKPKDDESYSDVPFNAHPRFRELLNQRNTFKREAEVFKTDAEQYRKVTTFLNQNGVTPDEAAQMLELRAMMKHDPAKAWETLKPMVQTLLRETGLVMPDDLAQRVQKGELTRDAALEISRLRATQGVAEKSAQLRQQTEEQARRQAHEQSLTTAATDWQTKTAGKDPDFAALQEDLMKEILWLQRRDGRPTSPDGVTKQIQDAYDTVKKRRVAAQPRPQTRPVTGGRVAHGQSSGGQSARSILEIVRARG